MQAWSAFIRNVKDIGREAWLQKLNANRVKFEKRTPTGAKFNLHRLSREAELPCLTWGDPCPCCVDNSKRVKGDVYSLSSPWGRARISIEMRDAIDGLQSIYRRQGRVFPINLLNIPISLVILTDEALNISNQPGTRLPAVM